MVLSTSGPRTAATSQTVTEGRSNVASTVAQSQATMFFGNKEVLSSATTNDHVGSSGSEAVPAGERAGGIGIPAPVKAVEKGLENGIATSAVRVGAAPVVRSRTNEKDLVVSRPVRQDRSDPEAKSFVPEAIESKGEVAPASAGTNSSMAHDSAPRIVMASKDGVAAPASRTSGQSDTQEVRPEGADCPVTPCAVRRELDSVVSTVGQLVATVEGSGKNLYLTGFVEQSKVRFLIDTGAEVTVINLETLSTLPKVIRTAFSERRRKLVTVSGEEVTALGPVLCHLSINGRTVLEAVCAAPFPEAAVLGVPALTALGCNMTVAGIDVLSKRTWGGPE